MNIMPNEVQKNGLRICADWISFTIPSWEGSTGALMAMSLLGYSHTDFQRMPRSDSPCMVFLFCLMEKRIWESM